MYKRQEGKGGRGLSFIREAGDESAARLGLVRAPMLGSTAASARDDSCAQRGISSVCSRVRQPARFSKPMSDTSTHRGRLSVSSS